MADLIFHKGETPSYRLVANRVNNLLLPSDPDYTTPIDMRGEKVTFSAKLKQADTAATIQKGTPATGLTGIAVLGADPGNQADIQFAASDTAAFTETMFLAYTVVLDDGQDVAVLEEGTLKIHVK
jgi:hypothetical protein